MIMRGAVAAQTLGIFERYVDEVFAHMWAEPKKLDDPAVLKARCSESALPADRLFELVQTPAVKEALLANTQRAVERGTFGSPTFFVDGEIYFGKTGCATSRRRSPRAGKAPYSGRWKLARYSSISFSLANTFMSGRAFTISKTLRTPGRRLLMPICPPFALGRFAVEKITRKPGRADEREVRHVERDHVRVERGQRLSRVAARCQVSSDPVSATRAVPGLGSLTSMFSGIWTASSRGSEAQA
jgi:hypothetical protein